jgi:hypothetical protein
MQAGKNALKSRDITILPHGDSFLFALATASILYAFVFRPDTIPKGYYGWMKARARVPTPVLLDHAAHQVKLHEISSSFPIDTQHYDALLERTKATDGNREIFRGYVERNGGCIPGYPCVLFHPTSDGCVNHFCSLWKAVFKEMIPVYFSLSMVPLLVLNPAKLFRQ